MSPEQKAAAEAWIAQWAAPLIADASVFTRGAYQSFLDAHKDELVEGIGNAVLAVAPSTVAPPGDQ